MAKGKILKRLLLQGNYVTMNRDIVKMLGLDGAWFLSNLISADDLLADKDGWFYQTVDTAESFTTLTRHKQDKAIESLEEAGIIEKDVRGIPAKRYFRIDEEALYDQIVKNQQTTTKETDELEGKKTATSKELSNKELSDKDSTSDSTLVKEKEPEKKKECVEAEPKKKSKYTYNPKQLELAELLLTRRELNHPNHQKPNIEAWANDLRIMMEQDKRKDYQVKNAIDWSQDHEFWRTVILSVKNLRKQYDQMNARASTQGKDFNKDPNEKFDFFRKSTKPKKPQKDFFGNIVEP